MVHGLNHDIVFVQCQRARRCICRCYIICLFLKYAFATEMSGVEFVQQWIIIGGYFSITRHRRSGSRLQANVRTGMA